ncbi:hypothetical protein [Pseudalkalibacillus decolorationis]|uniref:hypothetical protein n=1 Tax=Pseudalkalibacillus decolorationis TaxID=163879 RepID=UPI002148C267|nr:hypothetical protein [Pseudalkalibacillus decolorationis]
MNSQKELSYDRLASRTKYYQEKSLQLEKKLLFAEDTIEQLEKKLKEAEENDGLQRELQTKEEELVQYHQEIHRLKDQLSKSNHDEMNNKISGFEELLETVEKEMNEKEKQIDSYRSKIKSLEKRLKLQNQADKAPKDIVKEETAKEELLLSAYFNYSLICKDEGSYVIHGSFHMTNIGEKELENPLICFRYQPTDYTSLKGKIGSMEQTNVADEKKESLQWVFLENDWAKEARERGEIWIASMHELKLQANQTISLTDFQIPIQKEFEDSITIEAFVYFPNHEYRARAVNQIALNF